MSFHSHLEKAMSGATFDAPDMETAIGIILDGDASDIEIAGFLGAIAARGETVEEIAAAATAMRSRALLVSEHPEAIDTAGTGGDGADTFNISTAAALILAGAGVTVAKHGNRAATSKSGSSDVLAALGVNIEASPKQVERCMTVAGIGFLFAAKHHAAMRHAAAARKSLGVRTMFNVLGPLTNPARAKYQVVGVYKKELLRPMAEVLMRLGARSAWVVHGEDGLDEVSTTGNTLVAAVETGGVSEFVVSPQSAGLPLAKLEDLKGGDATANAAALRRLLEGEPGPYRDIAVLNAGAGLVVTGRAENISDGVVIASAAVDSGNAAQALLELVRCSNEDA